MTTIGRFRLGELQKQYSDKLLSVLTILLVLMLFVVAPFQAAGIVAFDAFGVIVGLVMIASVLVLSASLTATLVMFAAFALNIIVVIARVVKLLPYDLYLVDSCVVHHRAHSRVRCGEESICSGRGYLSSNYRCRAVVPVDGAGRLRGACAIWK